MRPATRPAVALVGLLLGLLVVGLRPGLLLRPTIDSAVLVQPLRPGGAAPGVQLPEVAAGGLGDGEATDDERAGPGRDRLDAFFQKLLRGESVTVYFLGESVTRGTGATHSCLTCADARPVVGERHDWVNQTLIEEAGSAGAHFARSAAAAAAAASSGGGGGIGGRGEVPERACPAVELPGADPYQSCTGAASGVGADAGASAAAAAAKRSLAASRNGGAGLVRPGGSPGRRQLRGVQACEHAARVCYPRNSWRCLVIHYLQHAFPGQVRMRTSAKPLLFMASCFGASLKGVDLVVHEYAVNGGGRMLCLQERVLRAALAGPEWPAVLLLLWIPKHFRPAPPVTMLQEVQANLAALGEHYGLPTLHMQRAFSAPCARHVPGHDPTLESWCYGRDASRHGEEGMLHGDMYHPNVDGHAFFAAHILELLERSALAARRLAPAGGGSGGGGSGGGGVRGLARLPAALHELNRGLDRGGADNATAAALAPAAADGARGRIGDGGDEERSNCMDVDTMAASAIANRGWAVTQEENSAGVKRLPALQASTLNASIAWAVDLRGVAWIAITYMQSYAGFAAVDVRCAGGCECALHGGKQESADVDATELEDAVSTGAAAARNTINGTSSRTKTSEPQWRILDVRADGGADGGGGAGRRCELRVRTVSPGKFKLMLVSLVRVAAASNPLAARLVRQATTGAAGRAALACFGVHDSATLHGHGMVAISDKITLDTLGLDDSRYWTRRGYKAAAAGAT